MNVTVEAVLLAYVQECYRNRAAHGKEPSLTAAYLAGYVLQHSIMNTCPYGWDGKYAARWARNETKKALARLVTAGKLATSIGIGERGEARMYEPTPE